MSQITIFRDEQYLGPFSVEEVHAHLLAGSLVETDFAWYEGLADWTPLISILEHFETEAPPVQEESEDFSEIPEQQLEEPEPSVVPEPTLSETVKTVDESRQPATDAQKRRLDFHGADYDPEITRAQATVSIECFQKKFPGTEKEFQEWEKKHR